MPKLESLKPRVQLLGKESSKGTDQPGKWDRGGPLAYARITGRALQKRNERIKLRDRYICQQCGRTHIASELDVDHRIPLHLGGTEDDDNLQSLCNGPEGCHTKKTKQENAQIAKASGKVA